MDLRSFKYFLFLFFLGHSLYLPAQEYIVSHQSYGVEDGLPHREINAIHQDKNGFIWVGTPQGISRFDGYQFQTFYSRTDSFIHDNIWRILEDADGWFWLLPIPPYEDFDIWHPASRIKTTFKTKFGKEQPIPRDHPSSWVTSLNDQTLLAKLDSQSIFSYHPERGIQIIDLKGISLFQIEVEFGFGKSVIAADNTIWISSNLDEILEIDWEGRPIQNFKHIYPTITDRTFHNLSTPFIYMEWVGGKKAKNTVFQIDREGNRLNLGKEYWHPSILPGADIPFIGEDILYDDHSFYQMDGTPIYSFDEKKPNEATNNFRSFIFTKSGSMWTGTDFGLQRISIRKNPFKKYLVSDNDHFNPIRGIFADNQQILLNVEHLGLAIINNSENAITQKDYSVFGFGNYAVQPLKDGHFAFSQYKNLGLLNEEGEANFSIIGEFCWAISQLSENILLIGTPNGLLIYNLLKKESTPFEKYNGFDNLRDAHITHISESKNGFYWLCTSNGFYQAHEEKGILAQYSKNGESQFQIPHDVIYHYCEETPDTLWLATGGGGLLRLTNSSNQQLTIDYQFTTHDGLSSDVIYAIYPDDFGNLWLSSDQGIMCFNKKTEEVQTFLTADGLPNNEFNRLAHFQSKDGALYFGTINGAVSFHPKDLAFSQTSADTPLRITAYNQFDGKENRMVERTANLLRDKHIVLYPDDRFFRLELALLNFHEVSKNRYAYRFKGISDEWEYTSERALRFGRLPYGKYELQIKGQDARGHWSAGELNIPVTVLRPFYLQTWFIVLAIALVLAVTFLFFKIRTRQLKDRQRELEKMVVERTQKIQKDKAVIEKQAEELQSLEKLKSRFFANVSHELRTPLSLMIGPLDSILKKESDRPEKERKLLEFVRNNSQHLLKLVNEILDLSKLETGRLEVKEKAVNFHKFLQPLVSQFSSFGDSESVKMIFDYQANPNLNILLDTNKFEKIVHNFLSNAIKFSPVGESVILKVEEESDSIQVSVTDRGPGIHPDDLPHIFDRFYQSKQPDSPTQGGTGIGLSLAAELAELLDGKIWVENDPDSYREGKGSTFFFRFPKRTAGDIHPPTPLKGGQAPAIILTGKQEGDERVSFDKENNQYSQPTPLQKERTTSPLEGGKMSEKPTILIVEDNPELRSYMQLLLEDEYEIITAENGKVGWEILAPSQPPPPAGGKELAPSPLGRAGVGLIISDLMMPVMDGFQLLEKIKGHETLRHLPVIMLTARADVRVKLRALRIGVDDYLTKPFVEEELQVRIKNLLRNYMERVKALAEEGLPPPPSKGGGGNTSPPAGGGGREGANMALVDSEWLEQIEQVFSKKLADKQFNMDWAASEMHLSTRQFTRRLKQLTGLTPNLYLREMRLQTARDILQEGKYNSVKEAGYAVGFTTTKYFSSLFQNRFGVLPSEYLQN